MRIINIPDISPVDDDFAKMEVSSKIDWVSFSGLPKNDFEKIIKVVRLSRYRGALEAASEATNEDVVVSHLPAMSAATSVALRLLNKESRHLAFSFNFTSLPTGVRATYMRSAFAKIHQFAVFSHYEASLYSEYFDLDDSKIVPVIWTQTSPPVLQNYPTEVHSQYFCAIGGEGRDIDLIIESAKYFSENVKFIIITRPHLLPQSAVPANVTFLTNTPLAMTWAIAKQSTAVLVPLETEKTCCGHITIVSAKILGIPIITTESFATVEYVEQRDWILSCRPKDLKNFVNLLQKALDERDSLRQKATAAISTESEIHSRSHWRHYVRDFVRI